MPDFSTRRRTMVDTQVRPSDVTKYNIIDALLSVPREDYVPEDKSEVAYVDDHVSLGSGRVVLEPRLLAKILDALDIQPDEMVLDLGCGLGYSTAVMARLAHTVVAIEEDAAMATEAQRILSSHGVDNAAVFEGEMAAGGAKHGPYDVIVAQGAVEHLPEALADQLREGGRMAVLFSQSGLGDVRIGYKVDGAISWRFAFNGGAPVLPGFEKRRAFTL